MDSLQTPGLQANFDASGLINVSRDTCPGLEPGPLRTRPREGACEGN